MADTTTTIAGNLTADPELRFTGDGTAVARFTVAVTERRRQGDQWTDGDTGYFRCSVWHKLAEHAAESLRKGDRVIVTGRLRQRSWATEGGEKHTTIEVDVDDLGPSLRWTTATANRTARTGRDTS
jgi:single-strand DNA-binding protein